MDLNIQLKDTISEISKSNLKFLASPIIKELVSYHLPVETAELSSGTAQRAKMWPFSIKCVTE
jgi:hypothetical protein